MRWCFYSLETGLFSGLTRSCSRKLLEQNIPPGFAPIEGVFDRLSQRVDLNALAKAEPGDFSTARDFVVAYERPAEQIESEQRARLDENARRRLREIDLAMIRPLAQLRSDPQDVVALAAIAELETEAVALRAAVVPTDAEIERASRLRKS